jgi:hypothetical protein
MRRIIFLSSIRRKSKKVKEVMGISRQLNTNFFATLIDVMKAKKKYKATPSDYNLFRFYQLSEEEKSTFFTGGYNEIVIRKMNRFDHMNIFNNKELFNSIFNEYLGRRWFINTKISYDEFIDLIEERKYLIYKPLTKSAGEGIEIVGLQECDAREIYDYITKKEIGLVEEYIVQHPRMSELCSNSVNTLRVVTINDNSKCDIIYTCLRIGNGKIIDNLYAGGLIAGVSKEGTVCTNAINLKGEEFIKHPISGKTINGFCIPFWKETEELAVKIYNIVPQVKYVGWDIAITQSGPILVEGNARYPSHEPLDLPFVSTKKGHKQLFDKYLSPTYGI